MLTILLKILGILGIVLLSLAGIVLVIILLLLFFPICYKVSGRKDADELQLSAKIKWLFGIFRMTYRYPDSGKILVKFLFFTIYDSSVTVKKQEDLPGKKEKKEEQTIAGEQDVSRKNPEEEPPDNCNKEDPTEAVYQEQLQEQKRTIFEKIRFTIRKTYDKMRYIFRNITFYMKLWKDPDTQGLLKHAGYRIGRILKRLRPGKLKLTAVVGTGSPDTTGYLYGLYGMLLPKIGTGICITPDFEQTILEGDFRAAGCFTLACILFHSVSLLLDKRLRQLQYKIKQFQKNNGL